MKDWNISVTTPPGRERELVPALNHLGDFTSSEFKGILVGRVEDVTRFPEAILTHPIHHLDMATLCWPLPFDREEFGR